VSIASHPVAPFRFEPRLPGDKSITHRAYLFAGMAAGESAIANTNPGEDCAATAAALRALGVETRGGADGSVTVIGRGGAFPAPAGPLDLGNSGTGLRLLLGVLAGQAMTVTLTGDDSLRTRPVERVLEPLRLMGARAEAPGDHPPVTLTGGALHGIRWTLPVPSAQVKSALLLAGIQAEGTTEIEGGGASRDHTERFLAAGGYPVTGTGDRIAVEGPFRIEPFSMVVPADPSAAAFWCAAAAVAPGSEISLEGVSVNPSRTAGFTALEEMGAELSRARPVDDVEPRADLSVRAGTLRGITLGPDRVPGLIDELPVLAVVAAFAEGATVVRGAGELKVKETDRLRAVAEGLRAIGAGVELRDDGWEITGSGGDPLPGGRVRSFGDHRIAMAFLIAGLRCRNGVEIVDPPGIETSDPYFLSNLRQILEPNA
jgi:3-phosphoshikimate 1-carboxyvinyltransferase